jgi:leucyl aminopeptidase (aminopeptidase T)
MEYIPLCCSIRIIFKERIELDNWDNWEEMLNDLWAMLKHALRDQVSYLTDKDIDIEYIGINYWHRFIKGNTMKMSNIVNGSV